MKVTRSFAEQVMRKRPEVALRDCLAVLAAPITRETQADGRIRYWGEAVLSGETTSRILRVVTLEDGETIHNAFFDRGFKRGEP